MAGALVTTNLLQTLVALGLNALRQHIVLAKIANRNYEGQITGRTKGSTVNIMIPPAIATRTVAPDVVPPPVTAVTPTIIPITLNQWEEAAFAMDDKGLAQVDRGIIPATASEAIKALANRIDTFLWGLAHGAGGFYGYTGTAGVTPFGTDLSEYLAAVAIADDQLMPPEDRFMIVSTLAKANALGVRAVQDASWRGDPTAFRSGRIGEVLGAQWDYSQNVPVHTAGTWTNVGTTTGTNAAGQGVVNLTGGTGSILVGNIVTFAGDTQTYVVTAATGTAPTTQITVAPNLVTAKSSTEVVTVKASHRSNLLVHPTGIAFAMSPLLEETKLEGVPSFQEVAVDEESGLALRLEVTRQHRQYQWAFDALWGGAIPRREFGVWIAG